MFAIFNPPSGHRKGRKSAKRGGGRKRGMSAYNKFVKSFLKEYPGAGMAGAASAWKNGPGKSHAQGKAIKAFKHQRAKAHRAVPRKFVLRSSLPGIVGSAMKANICKTDRLAAARKRYCGMGASTGQAGIERTVARFSDPDRLKTAAELGYIGTGQSWVKKAGSWLSGRAAANNPRRKTMRSRGFSGIFRKAKRGMSRALKMNPPVASGLTAGVKPSNIMGVLPIVGGLIINGILVEKTAGIIPYTKSGIGKYVYGLAMASVGAVIASAAGNKNLTKGVLMGGMAGTLAVAVNDVRKGGLKALTLSGDLGEDYLDGFSGMGDFATPAQMSAPMPTDTPWAPAQAVTQDGRVMAGPSVQQRLQAPPSAQQQAYEGQVLASVMDEEGF